MSNGHIVLLLKIPYDYGEVKLARIMEFYDGTDMESAEKAAEELNKETLMTKTIVDKDEKILYISYGIRCYMPWHFY